MKGVDWEGAKESFVVIKTFCIFITVGFTWLQTCIKTH